MKELAELENVLRHLLYNILNNPISLSHLINLSFVMMD